MGSNPKIRYDAGGIPKYMWLTNNIWLTGQRIEKLYNAEYKYEYQGIVRSQFFCPLIRLDY